MELKNKIDWQVKNLQECGLSIQAAGRNEFHVIAADVQNFAYYWTKKEPKTFENTSKTGKKYFVLAWKFDNVSKWVLIPTFKKIVVEDWYLIALERKFTNAELIKELDQAALGYDDVEPFVMKDDIYIKSVAKHNRDITKLNDAIAKNNTDLIEEEKEQILEANKAKRKEAKQAHIEKMEKLQESISQIRKEKLIKKVDSLQNLAIEKLNAKDDVEYLEIEDKLSITEIETYIDRIIEQHFEKPFLSDTLIIYLVKGISLIAKSETLTLNERNLKVDQYLLNTYSESISILDIDENDEALDENDEALDEEDIEITNNEYVSVKEVTDLIKKVYLLDKKLNVNNVVELLNSDGLTNKDIIKTLNFIDKNSKIDKTTVYKTANALASVIGLIYSINFDK